MSEREPKNMNHEQAVSPAGEAGFVPEGATLADGPASAVPVDAGMAPVGRASVAPEGMDQAAWEAYKQAVYAAADVRIAQFLPEDPRAAVPDPLRPGKHHVHKAYIWIGGVVVLAALAVAMLLNMVGAIGEMVGGAGPGGLGILLLSALVAAGVVVASGIVFGMQWLSWKNLTYELAPDEFRLYSGIISKKRRHVPYQRVQSVNQKAGVLQRIFGLCTVKVDTAGGAANEAILLPYVRTSDAEALRAELFRRKKVLLAGGTLDAYGNAHVMGTVVPSAWMIACSSNRQDMALAVLGVAVQDVAAGAPGAGAAAGVSGMATTTGAVSHAGNVLDGADEMLSDMRGVFGGAEVQTGEVTYEEGLSNKELLLAAVSGSAGAFGAIIAALLGLAQAVQPILEKSAESLAEGMIAAGTTSADIASVMDAFDVFSLFANQMVMRGVAGAILAVLLMWLFAVGATVVQYGGFKVRRRESRIEVEHGLLQRNFHGVDIDRVQSVIVKQGFVRRCIGYCELSLGKIDSAASGEQSDSVEAHGVVVHPFVKVERVPEILHGIAPELADVPEITVKPAPVALRRAIVRRCILRSGAFWTALVAACVLAGLEAAVALGVTAPDALEYSLISGTCLMYLALFVLICAANVVSAVLWFRHSGMGYDRNFMRITNGGLSTKTVVFPRKKIQFAYTKTNPFQRMAKVSIVNARTASGVGGTTETLWDVSEEAAAAWMEWVRPRK